MMTTDSWLRSVRELLEELSDIEFQQRVWVRGEGPEVSSYSEFMCRLFDDFSFDSFLDDSWTEFGLSETVHGQLLNLRTLLNDFSDRNPTPEDSFIVNDPSWKEISKSAGDALAMLASERKVAP